MRFTSKLKKKLNGLSNKSNADDHFKKCQCENDGASATKIFERSVTNPYFEDCRYCKFVPLVIGYKLHDLCDLVDLCERNINDAKQSRLKHLQIITKFIFSSALCGKLHNREHILHFNKKLEKETKTFKAYAIDKDNVHMLKISKEFQKQVKKTIQDTDVHHLKNKDAYSSEFYPVLGLNEYSCCEMNENENIDDGTQSQRDKGLAKFEHHNHCGLRGEMNTSEATGNEFYQGKNRTSQHENKKEVDRFLYRNCLSKHSLKKGASFSKNTYNDTNQILELQYCSRFGEINERHCHAISELVNQRLTGKCSISPLEVCIFIQENFDDLKELENLRVKFIYTCLRSFFFPGKDIVTVSIQRDLKQFLHRTVFQKTLAVKGLFGERHYIEDSAKIKAVLMVSNSVSALLRHPDVCLLDTLPLILDIDRDMLLVLKHSGETLK